MSSSLENFEKSISVKKNVIASKAYMVIDEIGFRVAESIANGNKVFFCGNGGSAADAQHLAAELLVRFRSNINRQGIPALALALDTSSLTACGNDYSFDDYYMRMIESLGSEGDCLIIISTSGSSLNIVKAANLAKGLGINVFGFLGGSGGEALKECDLNFLVPSNETARIQESHITAGHALIQVIEDKLLDSGYLALK